MKKILKYILIGLVMASIIMIGIYVYKNYDVVRSFWESKDRGIAVRILNFNDLEDVNLNWQGTEPQDINL